MPGTSDLDLEFQGAQPPGAASRAAGISPQLGLSSERLWGSSTALWSEADLAPFGG